MILTGGEHVSVLGAVRALREAGHAPWVAVHERGTYVARSRATAGTIDVPSPWDDPEAFAHEIAAATKRIGASIILPGTEYGMVTLAERAGLFPADVILGIPPIATIAEATDKGRLASLARAVGLDTPPTAELRLATLPDQMPFDFPLVLKPHRSELPDEAGVIRHHGSQAVASVHQLRAALSQLPGQCGLAQPFMPGPLGSLAGVSWEGRLVAAVQATADRVWPTPCGSISHGQTVPLDQGLADRVGQLLGAVGWNGIFQLDFFGAAGRHYLIDLNPRFYTSLVHATRAGMNLPAIWVDLLLGRDPVVPASYRTGLHYRHEVGEIRGLGRMLLRGPRDEAIRGLLPRRDTAYAVFSRSDPWPVVTTLERMLRRGARGRADRGTNPLFRGKGGVAV